MNNTISKKVTVDLNRQHLWKIISVPGQLNLFHPFCKNNEVLKWEKNYLKPWQNYIPVKKDLSDLIDKYQIIESDPKLYKKIIKNNIDLLSNQLSQKIMFSDLIKNISSRLLIK